MNKIKLFFGSACFLVAVGSALATKALVVVAPDYIRYPVVGSPTTFICEEYVPTECIALVGSTCTESATHPTTNLVGNYPIYDVKNNGLCQTELKRP